MSVAAEAGSPDRPVIETELQGYELLNDPLLNKGTAFSEQEREIFGLHGLLPPNVASLDEQVGRRLQALRQLPTDLARYVFLRGLQDSNEVLFYALLVRNLSETLPVVYTPAVGLGCQRFSHVFRKPRGLFLSIPHRERIGSILANPHFDNVETIVVTDGERILGLGDQGAGGMGIPIGKLALYTGCGGLHPASTLPIMLDVGTDNPGCLADPLYIGWHHARVRGAAYDEFVEAFVSAVIARWPHVLLQWEDFARDNATRLLERYRDRLCTFNDDIQGTAAVATGALLAAVNVTGVPFKDHRIAVLGAGSAGSGISSLLLRAMVADGLPESEARKRFFLVDREGLLVEGMRGILPFQERFVQARSAVADWRLHQPDRIDLLDVVRNAKPTVLIGVSGQPGAFTQEVVRTMAQLTERPVIFPLSNPTSRSEATPADLIDWTDGRAVIGTGSPFPPVLRKGRPQPVDQTNNAYVFPGLGLGAIAAQARRVSDGMLMAAARALADASPARHDAGANLLPPVDELRRVSYRVAVAVALAAQAEGLAQPTTRDALEARIQSKMWTPVYRPYRRRGANSE
ncbi:MAG TPA: NAD-dependent malic enzyme [Xanthobacteraceae bacterium]|nr:NAD-dependent malic enzyme [Xanthobacteraceae bacterium]